MTTASKETAENYARHQGYYDGIRDDPEGDNPRVVEITEYDDTFGGVGYGLTFEGERNVHGASVSVRNPRRFWKYEGDANHHDSMDASQ